MNIILNKYRSNTTQFSSKKCNTKINRKFNILYKNNPMVISWRDDTVQKLINYAKELKILYTF